MNKNIFCILCLAMCLLFNEHVQAQLSLVKFTYDANGNRVKRELTTVSHYREGAVPTTDPIKDTLAKVIITIAPNPTSGNIKISIDNSGSDIAPMTLYLYDYAGKIILQKQGITSTTEIDLSPFTAGAYQLRLLSGDNEKLFKVIKQ